MKKKMFALIVASIMVTGSLVGCGGSDSSASKASSSEASSAAASSSTSSVPASSSAASSSADKTESKEEKKEETNSAEKQVIQVPVTIINNTDVDFTELYTSGSGIDNWGEDLLGGQVLSPGTQLGQMAFNVDADNLKWDLLAMDEAGDSLEFYGLDLSECSTSGVTISLTYDRDTQTGTITAE